jgi:hypothetical protein
MPALSRTRRTSRTSRRTTRLFSTHRDVDLIILDVEGCELRTLMGAGRTIERCKPVIMVEEWGHLAGQRHTPDDLWRWLKQRGYHKALEIAHDHIWTAR